MQWNPNQMRYTRRSIAASCTSGMQNGFSREKNRKRGSGKSFDFQSVYRPRSGEPMAYDTYYNIIIFVSIDGKTYSKIVRSTNRGRAIYFVRTRCAYVYITSVRIITRTESDAGRNGFFPCPLRRTILYRHAFDRRIWLVRQSVFKSKTILFTFIVSYTNSR